jgi:hypothetical protein
MGFEYEDYVAEAMSGAGQELASNGYNDIMSAFTSSGSKKSVSYARNGFVNIRSDLSIGLADKANANKVLMSSDGSLAAEL